MIHWRLTISRAACGGPGFGLQLNHYWKLSAITTSDIKSFKRTRLSRILLCNRRRDGGTVNCLAPDLFGVACHVTSASFFGILLHSVNKSGLSHPRIRRPITTEAHNDQPVKLFKFA